MTVILPGDFCVVPVDGAGGMLISIGEWLNGGRLSGHDHAEIYLGTDVPGLAAHPYGYTASAYPDRAGIRALTCFPTALSAALWSSGAVTLRQAQRDGIVRWCLEHRDVPYSELDYFALAARRLKIPVPGLRGYIAGSGHMICSQYVDAAYLYGGGVHLFDDERWPGYVDPEDLAELIEKSSK
jgi:hypothetical protein